MGSASAVIDFLRPEDCPAGKSECRCSDSRFGPHSSSSACTVPALALTSAPAHHLSSLSRFSGESESCRSLLVQCLLHFEMQAASFPTDGAKVAYIIIHLTVTWGMEQRVKQAIINSDIPDG